MKNEEWLTVHKFSKKTGIPRSSIYFDIWTNKGRFKWRKRKIEKEILEVLS